MLIRNSINSRTNVRRLIVVALGTIIILNISSSVALGQNIRSEKPSVKERLFYGGSLGLQFGTVTDIDVSPVIGLWLLPRINVAAGPKYRFYKDPYDRTDIYGVRTYTQFFFIKDLHNVIPLNVHLGFFLHAEDELLSLQSAFWQSSPDVSRRIYRNTALAGVGISEPIGMRASINMMALWPLNNAFGDLLYELYANPEFRISFIF
ncbi:MAG: hypothetical protein NT092_03175 [Bacteroidia bacterium]|nr:hypothetical protein [Bacteroidia bacterium]